MLQFIVTNRCRLERHSSQLQPINGPCSKAIKVCFQDRVKVCTLRGSDQQKRRETDVKIGIYVGHENGMPWITIVRKQNIITERIADSRTWFGIHYA